MNFIFAVCFFLSNNSCLNKILYANENQLNLLKSSTGPILTVKSWVLFSHNIGFNFYFTSFPLGMQPVCYSAKRAMEGLPHWERTGSDICYYKNYYVRGLKSNNKYYHTATFTIRFPYSNDTCYLSYHYPFTLSMLNVSIFMIHDLNYCHASITNRL